MNGRVSRWQSWEPHPDCRLAMMNFKVRNIGYA